MLPLRAYVDNFCNSEGITKGGEDLCSELMAQQPDELVLSVYNLLVIKKQFSHINIRYHSKNEVEAEEYMALGVDAFANNDDVLSINYQTICIALSPPNSPLLPIAYAYRSASLFRLERFSASLMDVNRALQGESGLTGPSEDMKLSLLERKEICIAELKKEKVGTFYYQCCIKRSI